MSLPERSDSELRDALTHIAYERVALERAVEQFKQGRRRFDLEAALVHARNLTEFFWSPSKKRGRHKDGIYAVDYLPDSFDWVSSRNGLSPLPSQCYDAISAQLSHISIARSTKNGPFDFAAEIEEIASALSAAWDRWRTGLESTSWGPAIDVKVKEWRAAP
jgi:hypothetical protein